MFARVSGERFPKSASVWKLDLRLVDRWIRDGMQT